MTICDVCKTRPAATSINAQLRIGQKTQNSRHDICKECEAATAAIIETAAQAFVAAISGLKAAP
jgi:hypothetical protein